MPTPRRRSRQTTAVTTHLRAPLPELDRLRTARGLDSRSRLVALLVEEGLRAGVEHQHAALLEAAVERAVGRALERVGDLAFRAALDSDETRRLVMALLINAAGTERARALRREAHSAAWQRLGEPVPDGPPDGDGRSVAAPAQAKGVWQAPPTRS